MPQITEVSVRFMRRIQVRDYEPAEAEVGLKAILLEGEDAAKIAPALVAFVSGEVHDGLGLARSNVLPTRAAGTSVVKDQFGNAAGTGKTAVGATVATAAAAKPAKAATAKTPAPPANDPTAIPDGAAPAAASAPAATPAADPTAIPDAAAAPAAPAKPATPPATVAATPAPAASGAAMAPAELSKWVGQQVREGKITVAAVSSLYPEFNVSRLVDLKPEQVASAKAKLDQKITEHAASEGL